MSFRPHCLASLALGLFLFVPFAHAQQVPGCGALENGYGPFDYRVSKGYSLKIVEQFHFTPNIENLVSGNTGPVGGELSYTLHAFPNHHRALMAMVKLGVKQKRAKTEGATHSVECYMMRAERFRPDDGMVQLIYGLFHLQNGRPQEAVEKFLAAEKLEGGNANVQYNLGLAYFDMKQYDKSLQSARRAYAMGFPLPGLRDKLKRVGKWRDQGAAPAARVEPSPSSEESVAEGL